MAAAPDISALSERIPLPLRARVADAAADLDRVVAFQNRYARPAMVTPIEMVRVFEQHNPQPKRLFLVVDDERGEVAAIAQVSDGGTFARPDGSFSGGVRVAPEHRRRGVGRALLDRLEEHAKGHGARRITSSVREDEPDGVAFAQRHGYRETNRRYNSFLDVREFDASRFEEPEAIARRAGVRLVTIAELQRERSDVDALQRELYDVGVTTGADIPRPEPIQMPPYEAIRDIFFRDEAFDRSTSVVAVKGGRIVAETLTVMRSPGVAYTNITGTLREERGKGLALAMKLRVIAELKRSGARLFGTTNDEQNAAMRGINSRLGYVPDPPVIELERTLG